MLGASRKNKQETPWLVVVTRKVSVIMGEDTIFWDTTQCSPLNETAFRKNIPEPEIFIVIPVRTSNSTRRTHSSIPLNKGCKSHSVPNLIQQMGCSKIVRAKDSSSGRGRIYFRSREKTYKPFLSSIFLTECICLLHDISLVTWIQTTGDSELFLQLL